MADSSQVQVVDHPPKEPACQECDLDQIDDLHCESKQITKEASVTEASSEELGTMRTEFDAARAAYLDARTQATIIVTAIESALESLGSTIHCTFDKGHEKEIACLDESFKSVKKKLAECADDPYGCCVKASDCDFSKTIADDQVGSTIDDYTTKVAKAKACFDALKEEPTSLPERVSDLQKAVTALDAEMCARKTGTQSKPDGSGTMAESDGAWRALYVRFLKLEDDLKAVWRGFQGVAAYVDCLCAALTCVFAGKKALAKLEGRRAYLDCKHDTTAARCAELRQNLVSEVIADCERTCGKSQPSAADADPAKPQTGTGTQPEPPAAQAPPADQPAPCKEGD